MSTLETEAARAVASSLGEVSGIEMVAAPVALGGKTVYAMASAWSVLDVEVRARYRVDWNDVNDTIDAHRRSGDGERNDDACERDQEARATAQVRQ